MLLSFPTSIFLISISFITAFLSGLFGMAGGMILMGIMVWILPVSVAMILHGITQFASNGFRAYIHREHIMWQTLGVYLIGLFIILGLFQILQFTLNKPVLMILLGVSAFVSYVPKHIFHLDILNKKHAILCGLINTTLQLTVGVSGATVDIFFLNKKLTRHQVVATKAVTQALGHLAKLYYFGFALYTQSASASIEDIPLWVIGGILMMTFSGTGISKHYLKKMSDRQFHTWTRHVITLVGIIYIIRGIYLL